MFVNRVRHGLRRRLAQVWVDQGGAVTIQVLVMSILLLGTTGLVLDAGRAFSTHSQMQAFADQVALAAAAELDRKDDSITRARAAAFGVNAFGVNAFGVNDDPFLTDADSNGVAYEVDQVTFYADIPAQSGTQSDNSDMVPFQIADEVTDAATAQYVQVTVREREVTSLLSGMAGVAYAMTGQTNPFDSRIRLSTTAVAGLEIQTCADISSLVLCNPWEGRPEDPFAEGVDPTSDSIALLPGRSLQYFAPNFDRAGLPEGPIGSGEDIGSLYPYSVKNQIFRLSDPVSDPGGACSTVALQALGIAATEGSADYLAARDTCLMARARSERVCFGDTVKVRAADGKMVTPAINTIFDIYLEPFDQVLDSGDIAMPGTGLTLAQFFEPDSLAATTWEKLPRDEAGGLYILRVDPATGNVLIDLQYVDRTAPYLIGPLQPYEARPFPDANLLYPLDFAVGYDPCHDVTMLLFAGNIAGTPCDLPFVSNDRFADLGVVSNYITSRYDGVSSEGDPPLGTWYDVYKWERREIEAGRLTGSTRAPLEDITNEVFSPTPDQLRDGDAPPARVDPVNYLDTDGANRDLINDGYERRRVRSAMVNCAAATANPSIDGSYDTPIASVIDHYVPRPADYMCGFEADGTPIINCEVEDQIETRLFVELIERVDEAKTERFTAQLVR